MLLLKKIALQNFYIWQNVSLFSLQNDARKRVTVLLFQLVITEVDFIETNYVLPKLA